MHVTCLGIKYLGVNFIGQNNLIQPLKLIHAQALNAPSVQAHLDAYTGIKRFFFQIPASPGWAGSAYFPAVCTYVCLDT